MAVEQDEVEILGGVRHGRTLGSPVAMLIRNTEWPKWETIMSPGPGEGRQRGHQAPAWTRRPRRHDQVRHRRRT